MSIRKIDSTDFRAVVVTVAGRMRMQSALDLGLLGLLVAGGAAGLLLAGAKTGLLDADSTSLAFLLLLPVLCAAVGATRRVDELWAAHALDRVHGLKGLIASALEFNRGAHSRASAFEGATIERARLRARELSAEQAAPLRAPRTSLGAVLLAVALGLLSLFEVPHREALALPPVAGPQLLHEEDLRAEQAAVEEVLRELEDDPQLREVTGKLNELLEAMARRELSRAEALAKLEALERQLRDAAAADTDAIEDGLKELAAPMRGDEVTRSLAEALEHADAQAAADALDRLSKQLQTDSLDARKRAALRKRLLEASKPPADEAQRQMEKLEKERDRLLRKRKDGALSKAEKRLLHKRKRQLEKLKRDHAAAEARKRTLEKLRRKLAQSAQAMSQSSPQSAQRMAEAAQAAQAMARQQRGAGQRRRLQQRVGSLRELMRQQGNRGQPRQGQGDKSGKAGKSQALSLSRFGKAARGKRGEQGNQGGQGKQGKQGILLQPGEGKPGDGPTLLLPGAGQQVLVEDSAGVGQGGHGRAAGSGGTPDMLDRATHIKAQHRDSSITGQHGEGPSRSEVILEAASRGFASRDYEQMHERYSKHAESDLERDHVPGGYRFYVQRYFQLIRGREGIDE